MLPHLKLWTRPFRNLAMTLPLHSGIFIFCLSPACNLVINFVRRKQLRYFNSWLIEVLNNDSIYSFNFPYYP